MVTDQYARRLSFCRFLFSILLVMALLAGRPAFAQSRHIELNDYAKITSVSDPQISPDGKTIVFVVSRPNLEEDRSDRQLVKIDIATGAQHVLTYERKNVGSPRWSPTGDRLAFVAADGTGKDAKPQVFVLSMNGGEARRVTEAPNGIEQFAWRPNGQEIATSLRTRQRTRRRSKSIAMHSRSVTTISWPPKRNSPRTSGFSQ